MADKLSAAISRENKLTLVEREKLSGILQEKELSMIGIIETDEAKKIGALLSVDAIISGRVYRTEKGTDITIRVINARSGILISVISRTFDYSSRINAINAIEEITKRNTGEYAIRPFIRMYPADTLQRMTLWAKSENFHLRRLASEGLRPKLPWSAKLATFNDNPKPVFKILEMLKEDDVMFAKKSVANHLTDWLKVNKQPTVDLIKKWSKSDNKNTQWIIKKATRKISVD